MPQLASKKRLWKQRLMLQNTNDKQLNEKIKGKKLLQGCLTTKPNWCHIPPNMSIILYLGVMMKMDLKTKSFAPTIESWKHQQVVIMKGASITCCIAKHLRFLHCLIWQLLVGLLHALGWLVSKILWKSTNRIGLEGHACGIASWPLHAWNMDNN